MSKRIILHLRDGSDGVLALRAAKLLERDGFDSCVYGFGARETIFARRNKASITVYEDGLKE